LSQKSQLKRSQDKFWRKLRIFLTNLMFEKYRENIAIYCIILKYRVYRKKAVLLMGGQDGDVCKHFGWSLDLDHTCLQNVWMSVFWKITGHQGHHHRHCPWHVDDQT